MRERNAGGEASKESGDEPEQRFDCVPLISTHDLEPQAVSRRSMPQCPAARWHEQQHQDKSGNDEGT